MVINLRAPWDSPNVRFGSLADTCSAQADVRFTPDSGRNSGHCRPPMEGRAFLAPPYTSNDQLRYDDGIVDMHAEAPHSALSW